MALFERIRRFRNCGLVGESMSLGVGLWSFTSPCQGQYLSALLPRGSGGSSRPQPQCHACHHASCHYDNELTLGNCKQVPNYMLSLLRIALVMVSLHSNRHWLRQDPISKNKQTHGHIAEGKTKPYVGYWYFLNMESLQNSIYIIYPYLIFSCIRSS